MAFTAAMRKHPFYFVDIERVRAVSSYDQKRVCSCETRLQLEHIFMNFNRPTSKDVEAIDRFHFGGWDSY